MARLLNRIKMLRSEVKWFSYFLHLCRSSHSYWDETSMNRHMDLHKATPRRSRALSPLSTPRLNVPRRTRSLDRVRDDDDDEWIFDDDDDWIFDPSIDQILNQNSKRSHDQAFSDDDDTQYGGGGATHLLDFELPPVGAPRNWRREQTSIRSHAQTTKTRHREEQETEKNMEAWTGTSYISGSRWSCEESKN
ncbi:uncharacterized protein LOC110053765 [Orbicella faveolata]|uniref:uncharacterized protein LOC110053765 n=1 Tax=Orbicella faveolata TaxID=48498 RepID=UPI0009E48315|nr:uncharacterized protein LOC110053765 [Orbicella faveolata]